SNHIEVVSADDASRFPGSRDLEPLYLGDFLWQQCLLNFSRAIQFFFLKLVLRPIRFDRLFQLAVAALQTALCHDINLACDPKRDRGDGGELPTLQKIIQKSPSGAS